MKYKIGDRVKIINNDNNAFKIGEIAIIDEINEYRIYSVCCKNEHNCEWLKEKEVTPFEYTWEDFLKAPIGIKVIFESGNILVKVRENENQFRDGSVFRDYEDLEYFRDNLCSKRLGKIIKIEEPTYTTVYEPTEQVEEMTMEEVCKALGKNIKIVKEKSND